MSGKLAEDTNMFRGVLIKYNEPPEAKKPTLRLMQIILLSILVFFLSMHSSFLRWSILSLSRLDLLNLFKVCFFRWRLYPFKGDESLPVLHIHRQSAYLIGRDRKIADLPIDHPSCSKQHAVLQYRCISTRAAPVCWLLLALTLCQCSKIRMHYQR